LGYQPARSELRVGAAIVDVTPVQFPVIINGSMTSNSATSATTPIHARAIALEDGVERIAIVVVDSCMLSRPFLDEVKKMASNRTGIRPDRILISATHAHSVPSAMGCLGTDPDEDYVPFLRIKLTEAIENALKRLEPARVGWGVTQAPHHTAVRRWIRRPDRIAEDPFGNKTVRANMHAGRVWEDVTGESGPEDPDLSIISFQSKSGKPIAMLANFSMHYFGDKAVGADYFGRFCNRIQASLQPDRNGANSDSSFVAIMSHGCSGDIWRKDYTKQTPPEFDTIDIDTYTQSLADLAIKSYLSIDYLADADLAMSESRLRLRYRVPDQQRLKWAQEIVAGLAGQLPKTQPEIYAREQVMLHERQETEVVVQALRVGPIAIATTPTETYAITGMKLKLQSPQAQTMVIELANGGDGYIPPPEQHVLGGYNTWAARSAGLEVEAEPKIVEAALQQLEKVSRKGRRPITLSQGTEAAKVLAKKPAAYYRLDEMAGTRAFDRSGNHCDGFYEPGVVFFLEGPASSLYCKDGQQNRAAHFAGGRVATRIPGLHDHYSVSMWVWNGMPDDSRDVAGWFFGRGNNHAQEPTGDALGLMGKGDNARKLVYQSGSHPPVYGKSTIPRWTWAKITLVRDHDKVRIYLNENPTPEIETTAPWELPKDCDEVFIGGRGNRSDSWEGRIDEVAVFRGVLPSP
jgi:hypothetical protein